jgi:thiol:disulfide interchange protein DsbC
MKAIWCAKDRNKALDDAMSGKGVKPASCPVDISKHYTLGVQFGVNGTPAMVLSNGYVLPGYQGPKELKAFLMSIKNRQAVNNSRETTDTTTPP